MPNMPEKLCGTCEGEGRVMCAIREYIEKHSAMRKGAKGLADTPSHLGGNVEMATWLQTNIDADFSDLPEQARKRGCEIFTQHPNDPFVRTRV